MLFYQGLVFYLAHLLPWLSCLWLVGWEGHVFEMAHIFEGQLNFVAYFFVEYFGMIYEPIPCQLMLLNLMSEVLWVNSIKSSVSRRAISRRRMFSIHHHIIHPNNITFPNSFDPNFNRFTPQPAPQLIAFINISPGVIFNNFNNLKFAINHNVNMRCILVLRINRVPIFQIFLDEWYY